MRHVLMLGDWGVERAQLAQALDEPGLRIRWAEAADCQIGGLVGESPDLLCVQIDDGTGLALIVDIRHAGLNVPVMAMTRQTGWQCRVKALDSGADSCMVLPSDHAELRARVRALFRRGVGMPSEVISCGPISFDATGHVLTIHGRMVELSAREMLLLEVMLRRPGRPVSKDQLVRALCEAGDEISRNAIEVYVHRLRRKIANDEFHIATLRGEGYCLERVQVPPQPAPPRRVSRPELRP